MTGTDPAAVGDVLDMGAPQTACEAPEDSASDLAADGEATS
ncbi:hypothetical protein WKY82_09065 [Gordonia malaquae]